jgi:hypothetical protein
VHHKVPKDKILSNTSLPETKPKTLIFADAKTQNFKVSDQHSRTTKVPKLNLMILSSVMVKTDRTKTISQKKQKKKTNKSQNRITVSRWAPCYE